MQLIGKGRTAEILTYSDEKVIKLFYDNVPISDVQLEFHNNKVISEKLNIIPKVYGISEYNGRNGIIFDIVYGNSLLNYFINDISETENHMNNFCNVHYNILSTQVEDIRDYRNDLDFKIRNVSDKYLNSELKGYILNIVSDLPEANNLCHGDFHADNVLINNGCFKVIDWCS